MKRKLLDDCFLHDKDRLRHDEALALLKARVTTVTGIENVAARRLCRTHHGHGVARAAAGAGIHERRRRWLRLRPHR